MATKYLTKKTYGEKLLDPRWQRRRLEIYQRDNYTCQLCGDKETTLNVHHLYYTSNNPWEIEDEGLITYCKHCHSVAEYLKTLDKKAASVYKEYADDMFILAATNDNNIMLAFFYYHISNDFLDFAFCCEASFLENTLRNFLPQKSSNNGEQIP